MTNGVVPTLYMMRGLPGSGKTKRAREMLGVKRINKDDLRMMIDNGYYTTENEMAIRHIERSIAMAYLGMGCSVVVDDTNLKRDDEEAWRGMALGLRVKFQIIDQMDVSMATCIERDAKREKPVGADRIKDMARSFQKEWSLEP